MPFTGGFAEYAILGSPGYGDPARQHQRTLLYASTAQPGAARPVQPRRVPDAGPDSGAQFGSRQNTASHAAKQSRQVHRRTAMMPRLAALRFALRAARWRAGKSARQSLWIGQPGAVPRNDRQAPSPQVSQPSAPRNDNRSGWQRFGSPSGGSTTLRRRVKLACGSAAGVSRQSERAVRCSASACPAAVRDGRIR